MAIPRMTVEEAEQVLEQRSEMLAERGSSWVFGGGNPADANSAALLAETDEQRAAVAEAERVLREAEQAHRASQPAAPAPSHTDDIPF